MEGLGLPQNLVAILVIGSAALFSIFFIVFAYLKARRSRRIDLESTADETEKVEEADRKNWPSDGNSPQRLERTAHDEPSLPELSEEKPQTHESSDKNEGSSFSSKTALLDSPPGAIPRKTTESIENKCESIHRPTASGLSPGLAKTRSGWIARLGQVFAGRREIDSSLLEEIEKALFTADIGVKTSQALIDEIKTSLSKNEISSPAAVWKFLRARSSQLLTFECPPLDFKSKKPFVLLVIGVNGSGKTTTIGKLAAQLTSSGLKVLLAAGDTFRAAASEQLEIWAQRSNSRIVKGKEGADPSSVLFEGIKAGLTEGVDVIIGDTAGRLHTKSNLMEELQKVRRVIAKACPGAPHETWLVIDATSGQNAIAQAQVFTEAMAVSGIILTKLDGTAKGGVILGIADQLKIPVRYIGVGEKTNDLRTFDPEEFVEALFEDTNV